MLALKKGLGWLRGFHDLRRASGVCSSSMLLLVLAVTGR